MASSGTSRRPPPLPPVPPGRGNGVAARPAPRKNSRRKNKRRGIWPKIVLFFQIIAFFTLIIIISGMIFMITLMRHQPPAIDLTFAPPGHTYIYSSDDVLLADIYRYNRQVVPIGRIPKYLQEGTVAFEDKRFYQESGIDIKGILRSVYTNIMSGHLKGEGGSTITQQLARNMKVDGLTRQKTFQRKIKEWVVANQIEKNYTKQDILWMYLNYVNYGSGSYGVEAAAETYFGKDVSKLDLAQCALLAGLPNRPTDFSPYNSMTSAIAQRKLVLQRMLQQNYITPAQYHEANAEPIHLPYASPPSPGSHVYNAPYFTDYVIQQLQSLYGKTAVMAGNMKVYTTLNMAMQKIAENAVAKGIAAHTGPNGPTQACLVSLDPKTGSIKAMVGGLNYHKSQFNIATDGLRQPGSTFKAVLYSAAIDSDAVNENTLVQDSPHSYPGANGTLWTPKDDGAYTYRWMNLRTAVAFSVNTIAVQVLAHIGPPLEIRYARLLGITTPLAPVLSLALGSSAVTPLEMAGVYEVFPDGGNRAIPTAITEVDDPEGRQIFAPQVETQVLQKSTVAQMDDMFRAVVTEGTGTEVAALVPNARGKTGTTQDHHDVWFDGYTPNLVCVVWAGHPVYKKMPNGTVLAEYGKAMAHNDWGATISAPIWAQYMSQAQPILLKEQALERAHKTAKRTPVTRPKPVPIAQPAQIQSVSSMTPVRQFRQDHVTVNVDDRTGLLAPKGAPHSHDRRFVRGAQPIVMAPQYTAMPSQNAPVDSVPDTQTHLGGAVSAGGTQSSPTITPDNPAPVPRPRPAVQAAAPQSAPAPPAPVVSAPQYVTVKINPEDGLLATQWDPEVVVRRFLKGTQPRRYSHMYSPPPGEP